MANRVVYGVYDSIAELQDAIRSLSQRNVSQSSIRVVGEGQLDRLDERDDEFIDDEPNIILPNATVAAPGSASAAVSGETAFNQGGIYAIPTLYIDRNEFTQNVDLTEYAKELDDGKFLLLLDEDVESRLRVADLNAHLTTPAGQETPADTVDAVAPADAVADTVDPAYAADPEEAAYDEDLADATYEEVTADEDSTFDGTPEEDMVHYDTANDEVYDERLGLAADEVEIIEPQTTTTVSNFTDENETHDLNGAAEAAEDTRKFPVGEQFDEQTSDVEAQNLPTAEEETAHIDAEVEEVPVGEQFDEQTSDVEAQNLPTAEEETAHIDAEVEEVPLGEQFDELTSTVEVEHLPTEEGETTHIDANGELDPEFNQVVDELEAKYSNEVLDEELAPQVDAEQAPEFNPELNPEADAELNPEQAQELDSEAEEVVMPTHEQVHNTLGDRDTNVGAVDPKEEASTDEDNL